MALSTRDLVLQEAARTIGARLKHECACGATFEGNGYEPTYWYWPGDAEPPYGTVLYACPLCGRALP